MRCCFVSSNLCSVQWLLTYSVTNLEKKSRVKVISSCSWTIRVGRKSKSVETPSGYFAIELDERGRICVSTVPSRRNWAEREGAHGSLTVKVHQAFFFSWRAKGNWAVITSKCALKTSESQLSNIDGSTIKIGLFFENIMPTEIKDIKVSNPEISETLENVNFCISKIMFSKANQRILTQLFGKRKRNSSSSGV